MDWGEGSEAECKTSDKLDNCQQIHQYPEEDKTYRVTASYCNGAEESDFCCSSLTKPIIVNN